MTNDFVALLKDSSLLSVITVVELKKETSIFSPDARRTANKSTITNEQSITIQQFKDPKSAMVRGSEGAKVGTFGQNTSTQ